MVKLKKERKIYVLDTSVILYDHLSFKNFEDNDIALPITVLEELDNFKKGNDTKNYEAREFIRIIDKLSENYTLQDWIPIENTKKSGKFKIVLENANLTVNAIKVFGDAKADHRILNAVLSLAETETNCKVVLVTKDINLRLKAKALNIKAEDYMTGKITDLKELYTGIDNHEQVESASINSLYKDGFVDEIKGIKKPGSAHYYILKNGKTSCLAAYNPFSERYERIEKEYVYGIKPRNAEQAFAISAILNDDIKLVTLQGVAGTGKTLLSLAAALEQKNGFNQIILARPIVPLSNKEIGFLPGDANDKIGPYMEPLWDNLTYIKNQFGENEKKRKEIDRMIEDKKIIITPLAFIRGRSFSNIMFIIDEAQNLTPHEVKTIITRAGENTKIIFTGDIYQIDTPYLDEQSNGLSYIIDRLKNSKLFAHVTLQKGERSELANLANELL
ncbi:MAG: PhoH family protein [Bacteroidota bacterium]|nr:PhoH family protein [Bacteroidota bacterium]